MTPEQTLLDTYEKLIEAVTLKDRAKALDLLNVLDSATEGDSENAVKLRELYTFCIREIKCGAYHLALPILKTLQEGWIKAIQEVNAKRM